MTAKSSSALPAPCLRKTRSWTPFVQTSSRYVQEIQKTYRHWRRRPAVGMPKPKLTRWRCTNRCKTSSTPLNIPSSSSRSLPDRTVDWFLPARVRSPKASSHEVGIKPDFTAVDVPRRYSTARPLTPYLQKTGLDSLFGFHCGEGEDVRATDDPDSINANNSLTQAADYARIILAALPFSSTPTVLSSVDMSSHDPVPPPRRRRLQYWLYQKPAGLRPPACAFDLGRHLCRAGPRCDGELAIGT
ncbi:hypothetical protein BD413DRAFT_273913 [Trametes elegans]|nr:hypothetical protein BD413DRAFT_273913 [Trametes elegans]